MKFEILKDTIIDEIKITETPEALLTKLRFWNRELYQEKTELEFLEWLYEVIGDNELDYMFEIHLRIERLKGNLVKSKDSEGGKDEREI